MKVFDAIALLNKFHPDLEIVFHLGSDDLELDKTFYPIVDISSDVDLKSIVIQGHPPENNWGNTMFDIQAFINADEAMHDDKPYQDLEFLRFIALATSVANPEIYNFMYKSYLKIQADIYAHRETVSGKLLTNDNE